MEELQIKRIFDNLNSYINKFKALKNEQGDSRHRGIDPRQKEFEKISGEIHIILDTENLGKIYWSSPYKGISELCEETTSQLEAIIFKLGYQKTKSSLNGLGKKTDAKGDNKMKDEEFSLLIDRLDSIVAQAQDDQKQKNWGTYDLIIEEYAKIKLDLQKYVYTFSWLKTLPVIETVPDGERGAGFGDGDSITGAGTISEKAKYSEIISKLIPFLRKLKEVSSFSIELNPPKEDPTMRKIIPKKCFVVIASDRAGEDSKHEDRYQKAVLPGIKLAGYNPIRNSDDNGPSWFHDMIQNLRTCEMAVVDLTDTRFNCIWELGILNAWDVPVVIICPNDTSFSKNISDIFTQRVPIFFNNTDNKPDFAFIMKSLETKIKEVMGHERKGQFLPKLDI